MRIKPGYGYWDCTTYPMGGAFRRAGETGVELVEVKAVKPPIQGCDSIGTTADGRKVVFNSTDTDTGHGDDQ